MREKLSQSEFASKTQTSQLSYNDKQEYWIYAWNKFECYTFQISNNKVAEQNDKNARMRKLICAFVIRMQQSQVFSHQGPNVIYSTILSSWWDVL